MAPGFWSVSLGVLVAACLALPAVASLPASASRSDTVVIGAATEPDLRPNAIPWNWNAERCEWA